MTSTAPLGRGKVLVLWEVELEDVGVDELVWTDEVDWEELELVVDELVVVLGVLVVVVVLGVLGVLAEVEEGDDELVLAEVAEMVEVAEVDGPLEEPVPVLGAMYV